MRPMRTLLNIFSVIFVVVITSSLLTGCNKSYPCPGAGQMSAGDISQFDENGSPKSKRSKRGVDNGLVKKKQPKRLNANNRR